MEENRKKKELEQQKENELIKTKDLIKEEPPQLGCPRKWLLDVEIRIFGLF